MRRRFIAMLLSIPGLIVATSLFAQPASGSDPAAKRKPDLGDAVAGSYTGDVISDSKGSSRSEVTLTLTRTGRNLVRITSDYARLPEVEVPLTSAMGKIVHARGDTVLLLDGSKTPAHLDVSFHNEVSWSGQRR